MELRIFKEHYQTCDYQKILSTANLSNASVFDIYLSISINAFNNNNDKAQQLLKKHRRNLEENSLYELLDSVIKVRKDNDFQKQYVRLVLNGTSHRHPSFIRADYYHLLGWYSLELQRLKEAESFFTQAAFYFEEANASYYRWYMSFYKYMISTRLGDAKKSTSNSKEMNFWLGKTPQLQKNRARIETAILMLEGENYEACERLLNQARKDVRSKNRFSVVSDLCIFLVYVYSIQGQFQKIPSILEECERPDEKKAIQIIETVNQPAFLNLSSKRLAKNIKHSKLQPEHSHCIYDLVFKKLEREKRYQDIIEFYNLTNPSKDSHHESFPRFCLDYYRAVASHQIGDIDTYFSILSDIESDIHMSYELRCRKIKKLKALKRNSSLKNKKSVFYLMKASKTLFQKSGVYISLENSPTTLRALTVLAENSDVPLSSSFFFEEVYQLKFKKNLHSKTLSSLCSRLRTYLGGNDLLIHYRGYIGLSKKVEIITATSSNESAIKRCSQILSALRKGKLKISDLVELTNIPRRTLQLDLSELYKKGIIKRDGAGRSTFYRLK